MKKSTARQTKSQAARANLTELSAQAKQEIELLEATTGQSVGVNEMLVITYKAETNCTTFKTFQDWVKYGYQVKKGADAFRIWGQPLKAKVTANQAKEESEEQEEGTYKLWPMCCLFNESQVEKTEDGQEDVLTPEPILKITGTSSDKAVTDDKQSNASAESAKLSPFTTSNYNECQDAKKERLQDRAKIKRKESNEQYQRSHQLVEHIPFGQPILVGHHSERAHRNTIDKSWNAMGKSVALDDCAKNLENKAEGVGCAGIASDDPEAIAKLKIKLSTLTNSQNIMKAANKHIRKGNIDALADLGLSEALIHSITTPGLGGLGFASYSLQNNNAEIRRTKNRIIELEKIHNSTPINYSSESFSIYVDDGRIRIKFHSGKPNEAVRKLVGKTYSFNFSRRCEEWLRKPTANAIAATDMLLSQLQLMDEIY